VEIAGIAPVIAIGSEGGDEARHQGGPCPWQRAEDGRVGVIGGNGSDALVIGGGLISQDTELSQAGRSPAAAGFQNDLVAGGRDGGIDLAKLLGQTVVFPRAMLGKEAFEGARMGALQLLQGGPAVQ
jgi:hypothetical protein